jgi:hypothetical protein
MVTANIVRWIVNLMAAPTYAASVRALVAVLVTLNEQVAILQGQVEAHFGRHPDAEIMLSQRSSVSLLGELG